MLAAIIEPAGLLAQRGWLISKATLGDPHSLFSHISH